MDSNICCTACAAPASSSVPIGLAPVAGMFPDSLAEFSILDSLERQLCFLYAIVPIAWHKCFDGISSGVIV
jgi:hypothetical protein